MVTHRSDQPRSGCAINSAVELIGDRWSQTQPPHVIEEVPGVDNAEPIHLLRAESRDMATPAPATVASVAGSISDAISRLLSQQEILRRCNRSSPEVRRPNNQQPHPRQVGGAGLAAVDRDSSVD